MFWAFVDVDGQPTYCPLAEFGTQSLREGRDIYARAVVALPVTAHTPLRNAEDVQGKIAVLERGMCDFVTKVRHAQDAGAVAVIVANAASEEPEAAFVMDAGTHRAEATAIHIPSIMLPRAKAVIVFERIRERYLERRDYSMTIRFLGAQSAAAVLEQIENAGNQEQQQQREAELAEQREQQQVQATKLLRSRLSLMGDIEASPTVSPTPSTASFRSSSSNQSQSEEPQDPLPPPAFSSSCASVVSEPLNLQAAPAQPPYSWQSTASSTCTSLDIRSNNQELRTLSHWCPMTTALLVLDVQNYFALHQNESCLYEHSFVNLEYYKRIKTVMVAHIQDVLLACRSCEGVEVIYSVVESATPDGRDRSHAHKNAGIHVTKGGFGAHILPKIAPTENDIVLPRTGINVFEATNLDYLLRNLGVQHLVLVGISHLRSIQRCARSALDKGYQVTVLSDGLTLEQDKPLEHVLARLGAMGCHVRPTAGFVQDLLSFAEPDAFPQQDSDLAFNFN